jgi:hypothetical protein
VTAWRESLCSGCDRTGGPTAWWLMPVVVTEPVLRVVVLVPSAVLVLGPPTGMRLVLLCCWWGVGSSGLPPSGFPGSLLLVDC